MQRSASTTGMADFAPDERELLHAVRDLVRADGRMREATGRRMRLATSDMRATRFVLTAARQGVTVTPRDVARHLGLTTAATTTVLDRLVAAGHVERRPHPSDGRAKVVVPTEHARREAEQALGGVHAQMRAAAAAVPAEARPAVLAFLERLAAVMGEHADGQERRPGGAGQGRAAACEQP